MFQHDAWTSKGSWIQAKTVSVDETQAGASEQRFKHSWSSSSPALNQIQMLASIGVNEQRREEMSEHSALLGYTPEEIALKKTQARILYKILWTVHKLKVITQIMDK